MASHGQGKNVFLSFGFDYRDNPIDIEDVPRGPGLPNNGGFYDTKFWQTTSVHSRVGMLLTNKWKLSVAAYARYNHFHWMDGIAHEKSKKNLKYDLFSDAEYAFQLHKKKQRYLFMMAGLGVTNLHTKYNVHLRYITPWGDTTAVKQFRGTFAHFTPRFSIGYQFEKLKASLDAYFVEGIDRNELTAIWIGATISYELILKNKKRNSR
jgi:hypothetical protein